jgi:hypothetical protein
MTLIPATLVALDETRRFIAIGMPGEFSVENA